MLDPGFWILDAGYRILIIRLQLSFPRRRESRKIMGWGNSILSTEKQIKKWNRTWKLRLIEGKNPHWNDWHNEIL